MPPSGACGTSKDFKSSETVSVKLNEHTENRITNTESLPKRNVLKQFSSDSVKESHADLWFTLWLFTLYINIKISKNSC